MQISERANPTKIWYFIYCPRCKILFRGRDDRRRCNKCDKICPIPKARPPKERLAARREYTRATNAQLGHEMEDLIVDY